MTKINETESPSDFDNKYLIFKSDDEQGLYLIKNREYFKIFAPNGWKYNGNVSFRDKKNGQWYEPNEEELNKLLIGSI
jgi:hypothetical protein